ncbi:transposable element Tcb2 transposase [Trichonephila clavipes]|nr:transposable element Tcb2 transposase [Trichonephila clavipes]
MVWSVIAYDARSPLILIHGFMIVQRYVSDILQPLVLPLMADFLGAIFQLSNTHPHTARISEDCLHPIFTVPWPARSPDLSPFEHSWEHSGRQVGLPTSLVELEAHKEQLRDVTSQDAILDLYSFNF